MFSSAQSRARPLAPVQGAQRCRYIALPIRSTKDTTPTASYSEAAEEVGMTHTDSDAGAIAERLKAALQSADLDAFTELLDPNVQWGAPDDNAPSCQNRKQVLSWYQRGRDAGVRADVVEIVAGKDHLLVGLQVRGRSGE